MSPRNSTDSFQAMKEDWNRRAQEDPGYYIAFEKKTPGPEFWAGGIEITAFLSAACDLVWSDRSPSSPRRALEVGCGLGRLMRHLSSKFDVIHGVDISEEMIRQARSLSPSLHFHWLVSPDFSMFADQVFHLVYSFAVFQHIPDKEIVKSYIKESARVLRPDGVSILQFNTRQHAFKEPSTWAGAVFTRDEIADAHAQAGLSIKSLSGESDQYIWAVSTRHAPPRIPSPDGRFP